MHYNEHFHRGCTVHQSGPEWVSSRQQLSPRRWNTQRKGQAPELAAMVVPSWTCSHGQCLTESSSRMNHSCALRTAVLWACPVLMTMLLFRKCLDNWLENFTALLLGIIKDCIQIKPEKHFRQTETYALHLFLNIRYINICLWRASCRYYESIKQALRSDLK